MPFVKAAKDPTAKRNEVLRIVEQQLPGQQLDDYKATITQALQVQYLARRFALAAAAAATIAPLSFSTTGRR
jgi:hypothetical protein